MACNVETVQQIELMTPPGITQRLVLTAFSNHLLYSGVKSFRVDCVINCDYNIVPFLLTVAIGMV